MNRYLAFIDFDGAVTEITDKVVSKKIPQNFYIAQKMKGVIWSEEEIIKAAVEGNENVAVAKYALIYISSKKVFYGRFE